MTMKNVMVIADKVLPNLGANEICISKLLNNCRDLNISILCCVDQPCMQRKENQWDIYPVYVEKEVPYRKRKKKIDRVKYVIMHLLNCFFVSLTNKKIIKPLYSKAEEIVKQKKIDTVITLLNPPESVEVGFNLKKSFSNINYIIYDIDTISNCSFGIIEKNLMYFYSKQVFKWEKKVFSAADLIIHLKQHKKHFSKKIYQFASNKTIYQELPLLNFYNDSLIESNVRKKRIRLLYAGSFYNRLREPKVLMGIMENLNNIVDFELAIYTNKDYVCILNERFGEFENMHFYNYISEDELFKKIMKSDYLISLGNNYTEMFPSKIVTYISMLKPIIHIYQNNNDPVINYLKKYPDALLVDGNDVKQSTNKIEKYLLKEHKKIIKDEVRKSYIENDPAKCFDEIFCKLKENEK